MDEAVVGGAIGATVQVVVQILISLSRKEFELIRNFEKDMEKLRDTLDRIREFVNVSETLPEKETNKPVKRWLKKLENVAFQAYYVLDELDYLTLRNNRLRDNRLQTFKQKIKSMASIFYNRRKFGGKIRDINKDFESIDKEAIGLGLLAILAGLQATGAASHASGSEETDSHTSDPVFLGRDDDVKEIVEKLTNLPPDQVLSVLPIVGMGGMGKSTLAREVLKVQSHFGTRIWVHVSTNFDHIVLLKNILTTLTNKDDKDEIKEVVLGKLQKELANKTYLLVLDDVWNEERLKWEGLINSLSGITSTKGNCIIVTTRKSNVASIVATLPIHELQKLSEDSCWSIIKAKAFGGNMIPSEFETLGKNIAKKCQGLPLAANVVGGVLQGKSEDEWLSIHKDWLSNHNEGGFLKKVLKLSYDNLPSPSVKKCFAYCSIFPKGARMMRVDLIELWMAEGFLEADQSDDMETKGNKIFNLLLHNSLLQDVIRDDYNDVIDCRMHDLVYDVAMEVNDSISDAKHVRTFRGGIPDAMFSNFKSLHSLTLMDYGVGELPSSIKELKHLRYLNISETGIKYLPDTIGKLYHLQTLRAVGLWKLPSTVKYLISLRHLHVPWYTELPDELGMLTSLQTIPYFRVGDKKGRRIEELGSLKNLKGILWIYNLEKVKGKEEAKSACIFQKPNIVELQLEWNEEGETNYEGVLEGLEPHPNLKKLRIDGFKGTRFPSWALKMGVQDGCHWKGLNNLMEITLEYCSKCEEIPMMGQLPHLKSLHLSDLPNVKSISSTFYGIDHCNGACNDTIIIFPALERLELGSMHNLTEWVEVEVAESQSRQVKVFPCLKYLEISVCNKLKGAPSHFPCLEELLIYYMDSGLALANICGTKLTSLTKLHIVGLQELESLPHWLFYNNQHLQELCIRECPRLRELADGLHTLNSLQALEVWDCPRLKSIQDSSNGSHTSLRSLVIRDCPELVHLSAEMVESSAPSLERLQLEGLRSVKDVQMVIDCLVKMHCLKELALRLPKFIITSSTHTPPSFRSLRRLEVSPDSDSWDCVSFKEAVDGILMRLASNSLRLLVLSGKEDWEFLPDKLQHLSSIWTLYVYDFGIQELPEWFGNLSSLRQLALINCKRLRSMPSVEAMRRLTNLNELRIDDCPLLKERGIEQKSDDHGSQWPNISHIPCIKVDRKPMFC